LIVLQAYDKLLHGIHQAQADEFKFTRWDECL